MLTRAFALFVCCVVTAVLIAKAGASEPRSMGRAFAMFPTALGQWQSGGDAPMDAQTLAVLGVNDYLSRTYAGPAQGVGLYVGYWASQRQGDSIHSPLNCLPGAGWEPLSNSTLEIPVDARGLAPQPFKCRESVRGPEGARSRGAAVLVESRVIANKSSMVSDGIRAPDGRGSCIMIRSAARTEARALNSRTRIHHVFPRSQRIFRRD